MTTMELNLRKRNLIELVNSADEREISKIEEYVEKIMNRPKSRPYNTYSFPVNDSSTVAEPKFNSGYGHRFTQEELIATVNKAYQEAQNGECISNEEMHEKIEAWLKE